MVVGVVYYHTFRAHDVRAGTLVGEDMFGNKYFENKEYFFG